MANDSRGANKKPVNKPIIPKPPNIPKNGQNIYARQRLLNSPNNLNNSVISDDSDHLSEILNTTLTPRPLSSRLSKYTALPQIGARANTENNSIIEDQTILIGFRLPNGQKREKEFNRRDKISIALEFALSELEKSDPLQTQKLKNANYTLLQMPNLVVEDFNKPIGTYDIQNRSMLFLIEKNLIK